MTESLVGSKLGNYRLVRVIGEGRMGVVFLARDEALLRPTAVKVLSWKFAATGDGPSPEAWLLAEARNAARVSHPHVVQIYSVARHGGHCFIAMELVDGGSADAWMAREGPFPEIRALEVLAQTAGALQAAHDAGVVHRDLKPENILIARDTGKAKLGDFGMALQLANGRAPELARAGTPLYTAPEIWRTQPASRASDIYALGATFFTLLVGSPPYRGQDLPAVAKAHLEDAVPDPRARCPQLGEASARIVRRAMAKDARERYATAEELAREAQRALEELGARRRSSSLRPERPRVVPWPSLALPRRTRDPGASAMDPSVDFACEPFVSTRKALAEHLGPDGPSLVMVLGLADTGRSALVARAVESWTARGSVIVIGTEPVPSAPSRRAAHTHVAWSSNLATGPAMSALVQRSAAAAEGRPVLVWLGPEAAAACSPTNLADVARAAAASGGAFRVLVEGEPVLARVVDRDAAAVLVSPLTVEQSFDYAVCWLRWRASRARGITPDAALIVHSRSRGYLGAAQRLLASMVDRASVERRRLLTSRDAWMASRAESETDLADWPPPDVLAILNDARKKLGRPPHPGPQSPESPESHERES